MKSNANQQNFIYFYHRIKSNALICILVFKTLIFLHSSSSQFLRTKTLEIRNQLQK